MTFMTNTTHPTDREVAMFSTIQPGLLPAGTVTDHGTIVWSTPTSYEMEDGSFVSFDKIHGRPQPVMPLVVLR